jgi:hypothetical protein
MARVGPAAAALVVIFLRPAELRVSGPVPAGTGLIAGRVVDATTGRPAGEAIVTLSPGALPGSAPRSPQAAAAEARRVLTDGMGRFVFAGLPKGRYGLSAIVPGYGNGYFGLLVPRGPAVPIDLDDGEGRVDARILVWKYAVLAGRVIDEAGDPVVGAEVKVLRQTMVAGRPGFAGTATTTTDDRGAYHVSSLYPGRYPLMFLPDPSCSRRPAASRRDICRRAWQPPSVSTSCA